MISKQSNGFTLVELLLAISILAIVMLVVNGILITTLQTRKKTEVYLQDRDIGLQLLSAIKSNLLFATSFAEENNISNEKITGKSSCYFKGQKNVHLEEGTDSIEFLTSLSFDYTQGQSDTEGKKYTFIPYYRVKFYLQRNSETNFYSLMRIVDGFGESSDMLVTSDVSKAAKFHFEDELYDKVVNLVFEYSSRDKDGKMVWVREWNCDGDIGSFGDNVPADGGKKLPNDNQKETISKTVLPQYVKITIKFLDIGEDDIEKAKTYKMVVPIFTSEQWNKPLVQG